MYLRQARQSLKLVDLKRIGMATRHSNYTICVALAGMLLLSVIAQVAPEPKACAAIQCCCTAAGDVKRGNHAPGETPRTCQPQSPCCDIDPIGSHHVPLAAVSAQTHFRAFMIALQISPASIPLKSVESGVDPYRCQPPRSGNIPVYLLTLTLLC